VNPPEPLSPPTLLAAERQPDHPALIWRGEAWSYRRFEERIQQAAKRLVSLGLGKEARVGLWAPNSPDWAVLTHAILRVGAVLLPLNTRLTDHEFIFQASGVTALLGDPARAVRARSILPAEIPVFLLDYPMLGPSASAARVAGPPVTDSLEPGPAPRDIPEFWRVAPASSPLPEALDPDAEQAILFTSGTSGKPKGAVLTWGNQLASAEASASLLPLTPADRWLDCMPLFHVGGLNILFRCALAGATVILHERFDAAEVNLACDRDGATVVSLVAATLSRTLDARTTPLPQSVRAVLIGGGPVPPDLIERCPQALPTFGMTETCSGVTLVAPGASDADRATAGRPLARVELQIRGEAGELLPAGSPGMLAVRGPMVMRGYLDTEATDRALPDGWLQTGDFGMLDAEGRLTVLTRRDDLIVSGGENVYPAEIEAALRAHPAVREAAVVAIPHPRWGQAPLAFVVSRQAIEERELRAFLAGHLARYKLPASFHYIEALPQLSNGKIDRRSLEALALHHS